MAPQKKIGSIINHSLTCEQTDMLDLLKQIAEVVPSLEGWCPVEKAQWMATWLVNQRARAIVEIGVFGGRSLIPMGLAMKFLSEHYPGHEGKVVGVDSYSNEDSTEGESDLANRDWWATIDLGRIRKVAERAILFYELWKFVELRVTTSGIATFDFDDGALDLVHVDGQHAETVSCRDVKFWWPKLRPGGVLVMDDTDWHQLQAARKMAGALGKIIHHDEKWEVYQK